MTLADRITYAHDGLCCVILVTGRDWWFRVERMQPGG